MSRNFRGALGGLGAVLVMLSALAGCEGTGNARFVPSSDLARTALETALTAWRDGRPHGPIEAQPPIQVSDTRWQNGQQIQAFQIGEEEDSGDGTRQFPVKLTLKKDGKVQDVRYIVHGRDPVWIFSDEDYKRMIDMGNGATAPKSRTSRGRRTGR